MQRSISPFNASVGVVCWCKHVTLDTPTERNPGRLNYIIIEAISRHQNEK
jgi:hypothetical protein